MLRLQASEFVKIIKYLGSVEVIFETAWNDSDLEDDTRIALISWLDAAKDTCQEIGLPMSVIQIDRVKGKVESENLNAQQLFSIFAELNSRVIDEISVPVLLVMKPDRVEYYEKTNLFGDAVFNNFPSANYDIEEAGKCFATARYTACVMHLQRVLEIGLKSYGNCLGVMNLITTAQPSWQTVLDKTAKEIKDRNDKQNTNTDWALPEEKDFCEGIQPFLVAVKTAWRNPSMHADKTYSEEIAEDIYSAVKRFMKHLAEHIDESGKFTP